MLRGAISVLLFLLCALWARTFYEARKAFYAAQQSAAAADAQAALSHYAQAVRWRSPLNVWSDRAAEALQGMAADSSDYRVRLRALEELKSALASSRSALFDDESKERVIAEKLRALDPELAETIDPQQPQRSTAYQLLAQFGFWGWISFTLSAVWFGFSNAGQRNPRFIPLMAGSALMLALWIFALQRA